MLPTLRWCAVGVLLMMLPLGCASSSRAPMPTVESVDLERFMGDWYVIASIPTWFERDAYGAVESYELVGPRKIATTFTFRRGGFDGPEKRMTPTGFVREGTGNAVWGMRFLWPFRAEYRIIYLDDGYETTVIGRSARDYAWIMARRPTLPDGELDRLEGLLQRVGYDVSMLRVVPQRED